MTAGQRAAARALLKPEGEKGGRGKTLTETGEFSRTEANALSQARFVLSGGQNLRLALLQKARRSPKSAVRVPVSLDHPAPSQPPQASTRARANEGRKRDPAKRGVFLFSHNSL